MNKEMYGYLVSPVTHKALVQEKNALISIDGSEVYSINCKVPVMLSGEVPEWHRELIEVILWQYPEEIEKMYSEVDWSKSPIPIYVKYIRALLHSKQGIIEAFERYSESETHKWIVKQQNKKSEKESIKDFRKLKTRRIGKHRFKNINQHKTAFAKETLKNNPAAVLELATGAGGGTNAVAFEMPSDCLLFTVDIHFTCLGNALAVSKYLRKPNIMPVCANFWHLPFAGESMDTVCTNFGLDESRENKRTLSEVARVLKKGGRFVCMARKNAFMRQAAVLEPFGFTKEETVALLKKCRLYADCENLVEECNKLGIIFESSTEYASDNGVVFVLMSFMKE